MRRHIPSLPGLCGHWARAYAPTRDLLTRGSFRYAAHNTCPSKRVPRLRQPRQTPRSMTETACIAVEGPAGDLAASEESPDNEKRVRWVRGRVWPVYACCGGARRTGGCVLGEGRLRRRRVLCATPQPRLVCATACVCTLIQLCVRGFGACPPRPRTSHDQCPPTNLRSSSALTALVRAAVASSRLCHLVCC
jgi:hypothetical protein